MLRTRQADPEAGIAVRSLGLHLATGRRLEGHAHPWGQLIYASEGILTVETDPATWVVPPQRAVWVPARVEHSILTTGAVKMRTVYLRPDLGCLPAACCVMRVPALLRELLLHIVRRGMLDETLERDANLIGVLLEQLEAAPEAPLELPLPRDPRARRIADRLRHDPADGSGLDALARGSGASRRTLERLFQRETGMSFGRWRQQAHLLHGLRRLAEGASVTAAALDAGYDSTSAFIAVFKRAFGTTPGRYYRTQEP